MFRPISNIGKCTCDSLCDSGAMCVSPYRKIYWSNCVHQIIEYNLTTKTWRAIHQHDSRIRDLFWFREHLYFIGYPYDKFCIDILTSCRYIESADDDTITHWWYDENWGVHAEAQSYFHRAQSCNDVLTFNGESFVRDKGYPFFTRHLVRHLDGTPVYDNGQTWQVIYGQTTTDTERVLYVTDNTWPVETTEFLPLVSILIRISLDISNKPTVTVLTKETFDPMCINSSTGEIYIVDNKDNTFTLCVYEYPVKSLIDLCIDVISLSPTLRQAIPLLPVDLRMQERLVRI